MKTLTIIRPMRLKKTTVIRLNIASANHPKNHRIAPSITTLTSRGL